MPGRNPSIGGEIEGAGEVKSEQYVRELCAAARLASYDFAVVDGARRDLALAKLATLLRENSGPVLAANVKDVAAAKDGGLSPAAVDRLTLNEARIGQMAVSVDEIRALPDPLGQVIEGWVRPNGLKIEKIRVPIGVVACIFESRPNVTTDIGALCIKSGNVVILRGGKEAFNTNMALGRLLKKALTTVGLDDAFVNILETTDHAAVAELLTRRDDVDVVIPRGGKGLIEAVVGQAQMPVIKHYEGICHVYVHEAADFDMALEILVNAKCQRPGVCNACETLLVDAVIAERFLPLAVAELTTRKCRLRGCRKTLTIVDNNKNVEKAEEADWSTEYLDLVLSIMVVDNAKAAVGHINRYSSKHTDAIITNDIETARFFQRTVDSACVMVNCSTRFSDGGEFGMGAEVGISTDKIHARGPMGVRDLTTYKYLVEGNGQIRG